MPSDTRSCHARSLGIPELAEIIDGAELSPPPSSPVTTSQQYEITRKGVGVDFRMHGSSSATLA